VLGDRAVIDAARAGKPDAALCQFVPRKLVGAGTDRLDKTEFRRAVEKTVLPQTRDPSTWASPIRFSKVSKSRAAKLLMPVLRVANRSHSR
jgi:hypothetical protein